MSDLVSTYFHKISETKLKYKSPHGHGVAMTHGIIGNRTMSSYRRCYTQMHPPIHGWIRPDPLFWLRVGSPPLPAMSV